LKLVFSAEKSAPNHLGIYHDTYRPDDASRSLHCYYLCDPDHNEYVKSPLIGKACYDTIPELIDEIEALERASRNKEQRQLPADVVDLVSKANALVHESDKLEDERAAKRRRQLEINNSSHSSNSEEATTGSDRCDGIDEKNGDEATSGSKPPQLAPGFNIWWDSMCAQRLFNSSKERETVVDRLLSRLITQTRRHCHTRQLSRVMMQRTQ